MFRKLMLLAALALYVLPTPALLAQQDTGVTIVDDTAISQVPDSATNNAGNPLDWGKAELLKWLIPLLGSVLFKAWNKAGGWIAGLANELKMGIYIGLITGMMFLGEFIHTAVSQNPADWGGTFWESIAAGLLGTLLVKMGITTAREKSPAVARAG